MKKFRRYLSSLLAALLIVTGLPIGAFTSESQAKSVDQGLFLAQGTRGSLPSLMELLQPQNNPGNNTQQGRESETVVTTPDIQSTAVPEESPETNDEDGELFEGVRTEMEKSTPDGADALPVRELSLNGNRSLVSVSYQIHEDQDGLPQSISWVLTYYAPQESEVHQAFVVNNGDGLGQPLITNREYAPGEAEVMESRKTDREDRLAQGQPAPVFIYDTETRAANPDGFFMSCITTPIHRDESLTKKIQAAKAGDEIDQKALEEIKYSLQDKIYSLTLVSFFGQEKVAQQIQVKGDSTLADLDAFTTPIATEWTRKDEKEHRLLFAVPNMDKKASDYIAPTFPASAKGSEKTNIRIFDLVLSYDGFYDFLEVEEQSLDQYEKKLEEIRAQDLDEDALNQALEEATLKVQPGQIAVTVQSETEKVNSTEEEKPEIRPAEPANPSEETSTENSEDQPDKEGSLPEEGETSSRQGNEETEKASLETKESVKQTLGILSLARLLKEAENRTGESMLGAEDGLYQPMGAPVNPFVVNRPIIIEVVDSENKGVKIPGAVVRISGPDMVKEVTTDENGQAKVENCNAGKYQVVQISAPEGYMPNQKKIEFFFSAIETVKYVRIEDNKNFGKEVYFIEGTVVDDALTPPYTEEVVKKSRKISNVELTLQIFKTNADGTQGEQIGEKTAYTDAQGHYIFGDLDPAHMYQVVAAWAPYEYSFVEEPSTANGRISDPYRFRDEKGQPIPIVDEKTQEVVGSVYKYVHNFFLHKNNNADSLVSIYNHETGDTTVRLSGSTFQILNKEGEAIKSIGKLVTNREGKVEFRLRPGQYIIEQLTTDSAHLIPKARTIIQVKGVASDPTQNAHWIPNPLRDITSVTYDREATIDWGQVTPDPAFQLLIKQNGKELTNKKYVKDGYVYRFEKLRKYDDNHQQYAYQIILKETPDYYATYEIIDGVVNIKVHAKSDSSGPGGSVTVTGNKIWYNDSKDTLHRPDSIQVVLLENGKETAYQATVSAQTGWKYRFSNLPERDNQGKKITYTVKEIDQVSGQGFPGYRTDPTRLERNIINTRINDTKIAGSFRLQKLDQNKQGLKGAWFALSGTMENGKALDPALTGKTDDQGWLTFSNIPAGTYTLKETSAPDRFEPSTETWKVEVSGDGTTILTGSGVHQNQQNQGNQLPDDIDHALDAYVMDGMGSQPRTVENRKAKNPKEFRKTLYTQDGLSPDDQAKEENQVGDISKRILNTVDKNLNEYQVELTVTGRGRPLFGSGEKTDIVVVADHSGSIQGVNQTQVNQQVREIFNAFSGFTNVKMGYIEYGGPTVDKNQYLGTNSNNLNGYHLARENYEVNADFDGGHDPAVRKSVELTSPENLLQTNAITDKFGGSTFTQRALLRAQEILDKGEGVRKHIILITDGGPTVSFKATQTKWEDTAKWSPIYKPLPGATGEVNIPNSGLTYGKRATAFDYSALAGDGLFYKFIEGQQDTRLNYTSYDVDGETIIDSVFATVSTVRNLTEAGIEISTIGYNLKPEGNAGMFGGQEQYFFPQLASSPRNYSGVGSVLDHNNAASEIFEEVQKQYYLNQQKKADPTIKNATVTDPMGDGVEFSLGDDGVFNEKDYVLVGSDGSIYENGQAPSSGLLNGTSLRYDEQSKTLKIEGLTLGSDESVSLYYTVRLKDEARDGKFRDTNKPTTLLNEGKTYHFPIPAIRDKVDEPYIEIKNQPYSATGRFRIIKTNEDGEKLEGAYFVLTDEKNNHEIQIQPSNKDGLIEVNNLAPGEYILREEVAPAGYVVSSYRWKITVDQKGGTKIVRIVEPQKAPSFESSEVETVQAMAAGLSLAPMMGFAPVRANAPGQRNYRISASSVFEDGNNENKFFHIRHEVEGKDPKTSLDLYFLMVPDNQGDVTYFNARIKNLSTQLNRDGYQGRINVIYGGYDAYSSQLASWDISQTPQVLTNVPLGDNPNGAFMDRALAYANRMLENAQEYNTVKMVAFLSNNRDFTIEETYAQNLEHMAEMGVVSQYISITRNNRRKEDLSNFLLDYKNTMSQASKQEILSRLQSWDDGEVNVPKFKERVDAVFASESDAEVINNQALRIPLGANIHYRPDTARAMIVDGNGQILDNVTVRAQTVGGFTTLETDPVSLSAGQRLKLDYQVTLMNDYERAVSYSVYATGAPKWVNGDGSTETADIQPLYISDPGQTLEIEAKGLDGYPGTVHIDVTTQRSNEKAGFDLHNRESANMTILTFDAQGNTQGPGKITVTGSDPTDKNYTFDKVDKNAYPRISVIYKRELLNLTVRKVFNNRLPEPGEKVEVTLIAKVDGQEIPWSNLGNVGPATRSLEKKSDGIYETVYQNLPLNYQGKPIEYSVKKESSETTQGEVTIKREQTVTSYRPEEDLIRVDETELPILTVVNANNELKFKKVGASGYQYDKNGNIIVDDKGEPIIDVTPLPGTVFKLCREDLPPDSNGEKQVVPGYENVISGPDGKFVFKNLAPGDYGLYETHANLGYELPVQAVATFTIDANGKPKEGTILSFKERNKKDGDYILGIKRTLVNKVQVETAITQLEATDHNVGQRKMLYTQRVYLNRTGENMTSAILKVSSAGDNPILKGSYKVYRVTGRKPDELDFNKPLDPNDKSNYDLELVKSVPEANLSDITLDDLMPSTDFFIVEIKGELAVHDVKFATRLNMFVAANENPAHRPPHDTDVDYKNNANITITTGYRKGDTIGEQADILVPADKDQDGESYLVKNYRGSTFFSVQKTEEGSGLPLAGAKFKLWAALGRNFEIVETEHTTKVTTESEEITDRNGIVTFENLPANYNFYLEETKTAPGFALPDYMWIVQIRPTSYLKELHKKSRNWEDYLPAGMTAGQATPEEKAAAQEQARTTAYNQMLYPFGSGQTQEEIETDQTAEKLGFKTFVYRTDSRLPLIVNPMNSHGQKLPKPVDPEAYERDREDDVYAEQSYGQHPTIHGMWYRKGWVNYEPQPTSGETGQMMPINEAGEPIKQEWKNPATKWKGEQIDGVSGATIRPLIVRDWIQDARDFDPTLANYDEDVRKFNEHILEARNLFLTQEQETLTNVLGITNKKSKFFINKVDENREPLEGAKFVLYKQAEDGKWVESGIEPRVAKNQTIFENLDDGIYILQEKEQPAGYEKPNTQWRITVEDGAVTKKTEEPWQDLDSQSANRAAFASPAEEPTSSLAGGQSTSSQPLSLLEAIPKTLDLGAETSGSVFRRFLPQPLGATGDFYAKDNAHQPTIGDFRANNPEDDVRLGVKITSISDINKETGRGTFKAIAFVDGKNYASIDARNTAGAIIERYLGLNLSSGLALTGATVFNIPETLKESVDFGFTPYQANGSLKSGIVKINPISDFPVTTNARVKLIEGKRWNQHFIEIEGTYENAEDLPITLDASYDGEVINRQTLKQVRSQAKATSQVYHYDRYLVTFDSDGGTPTPPDQTIRINRTIEEPPEPTKTGYRFKGWDENGNPADFNRPITEDHSFKALWEKSVYTVTFHREENDTPDTQKSRTVTSGQPIGNMPDTSFMGYKFVLDKKDQGYQFAGWQDEEGNPVSESTPVNRDMDLYPIWRKEHTINFLYRNNVVDSKIVEEGKSYLDVYQTEPGQYPPNTTYPGFEWDGWYTSAGEKYDFGQPVTRTINLHGKWKRTSTDSRTITFQMIDKDGYIQTGYTQYRSVNSGEVLRDIPDSKPEEIEGFTFSGWKHWTGSDYVDVDFTQPITKDMTVYGYWVEKTYQVTFTDGSKVVETYDDVPYGTTIPGPVAPTKEGYYFLGWMDGETRFDPNKPVTANANYTAKWQEIVDDEFVIRFDSKGGSSIANVVVKKGDRLAKPAPDPTREGYNFKGWYLPNGQLYDFSQPVQSGMTLTAAWERIPDPDQGGELTIENKKKEFFGEFTLSKFEKTGTSRVQLSSAFFTLKKHEGAEKPEYFSAEEYVKTYNKSDMWASDIKAFKTDKKGELHFDNLQPGVYDLEEYIPPGGYLKDTTGYVIVVNTNGDTVIVPRDSYSAEKYPVDVDYGEDPGTNPDKPEERTEKQSLDGEIQLVDSSLVPSKDDGIVRPLEDQNLQMQYTIRLPEDAIPGDTFTVKIDDRLNFHGLTMTPMNPGPIVTENGEEVAEAQNVVIDESGQSLHEITYKLTNYVKNRSNIEIKQRMPLFVDPNRVTANNTPLKAEYSIGGNKVQADPVVVSYDPYYGSIYMYDRYNVSIDGYRQMATMNLGGRLYDYEDANDPKKGTITAYYYAFGTNCSLSSEYWLTLEDGKVNDKDSDVDLSDPTKIQVQVYETSAFRSDGNLNTETMPPSYGIRSMDLTGRSWTVKPEKDQYNRIKIPLFQVNQKGRYQFGYIIKVTMPYAAKEGSDRVTLHTKATLYTLSEFSDGYGSYTMFNGVYYANYLNRYLASSDISSEDRINVTLTKRGLTGKPGEDPSKAKLLAGAGFQLTNNEGFSDYVVTNDKGQIIFKNLKPGNYFLKEVVTPKGYTPVSTVWDLTIDEKGRVTIGNKGVEDQIQGGDKAITVWNSKVKVNKPVLDVPNLPNQIRFTKQDEQGVHLAGAKFTLKKYDKPASATDRKEVWVDPADQTKVSGDDGIVTWQALTPGYYEVWETEAPKGYVKPTVAVATFRVDKESGEIKDLKINGRDPVGDNIIYNRRPMKIELGKLDENRAAITEDKVIFTLEAAEGNAKSVPTDLQTIELDLSQPGPYFREIPDTMDGDYILTEKTAPAGYVKSNHRYHIHIDQAGRIVQLTKVTDENGQEVAYLDHGLLGQAQKPFYLYQDHTVDQVRLDIVNHRLYTLPSTAGPGTFLFTLVGAFLLSLAISLLRKDDGRQGRPRKGLRRLRRQLE
ncbi:SpaA isopeptide-forming pilin-related protein [Kallipyga gabonensis]|uniref:SpaA isopeptide-forming pilin-related protein n=1 Tax=Kallipyga gabonensis TaxID=1686287 RepID=UPI000A84D3DB|nr:SpaA isopeptide-forming pilin-related protein [Kallipyga gabonensis]